MPSSPQQTPDTLNDASASQDNTPPVAVADQAVTTVGTPVLIDVLANDHDPDGDPLKITALTLPAHGTVGLIAPGTMRYVPQAGFVGIDYFSYTVGDGSMGRSTAWVEVRVGASNRPPEPAADRIATTRDQPVTFDVLANDGDPDGDPLTITGFTLPANGQLAYHADRTFTYTPGPGFVGEDGFAYSVSDGQGGTAQAEVTLLVEWPNQAPVAAGDQARTTRGTPVTIAVLANDSDADGDPLRLIALVMPVHGRLAVNPDQSLTYTPDADFLGTDDFGYTIDDGRGGRSTASVVVDVVEAAPSPASSGVLITSSGARLIASNGNTLIYEEAA